MNGRQCSAVINADSKKAPGWLALSDEEFAARVHAQAARSAGKDIGNAEVLARYGDVHRRTTLPTPGHECHRQALHHRVRPGQAGPAGGAEAVGTAAALQQGGQGCEITRQLTGRHNITLAG
jgi:hypothetical protein